MDRRSFLKNATATPVVCISSAQYGTALFQRLAGEAGEPEHAFGLVLRPPGALDEEAFSALCIRCLRCADACPNNAILPLEGEGSGKLRGSPVIKARRQACMLCNRVDGPDLKCTAACPSGALQPIANDTEAILASVAMGTAVIDVDLCYSYNDWTCGACYRACPFPDQAMTLGLWEKPTVHPDHCVGCGLCERACIRYPQAIRVRPA